MPPDPTEHSGPPVDRPDLTVLDEAGTRRVHAHLRRHEARCPTCGHDDFETGDALALGFLFRSEDLDAYLVALTCTNPVCPAPRTAVRLVDPP